MQIAVSLLTPARSRARARAFLLLREALKRHARALLARLFSTPRLVPFNTFAREKRQRGFPSRRDGACRQIGFRDACLQRVYTTVAEYYILYMIYFSLVCAGRAESFLAATRGMERVRIEFRLKLH